MDAARFRHFAPEARRSSPTSEIPVNDPTQVGTPWRPPTQRAFVARLAETSFWLGVLAWWGAIVLVLLRAR